MYVFAHCLFLHLLHFDKSNKCGIFTRNTTFDIKIKTLLNVDDETRVILETDEDNPGDYINASFIHVHHILFYAQFSVKVKDNNMS